MKRALVGFLLFAAALTASANAEVPSTCQPLKNNSSFVFTVPLTRIGFASGAT